MNEEPEMPVEIRPKHWIVPSSVARLRAGKVPDPERRGDTLPAILINSTAIEFPAETETAKIRAEIDRILGMISEPGEFLEIGPDDWVRPDLIGEIQVFGDDVLVDGVATGYFENDSGEPETIEEQIERIFDAISSDFSFEDQTSKY